MRRYHWKSLRNTVFAATIATAACDDTSSLVSKIAHPLSVRSKEQSRLSGDPAAGDAILGVIARSVSIRSRPSVEATVVGMLTAGTIVKRSNATRADPNCRSGWYAVAPRGYVCANEQTTTDPRHPTLQARGLAPDLTATFPYPYASALRKSSAYEPDPRHRDGVRELGIINKGSTFAVVGSWNTLDEYDQRQHLALLTLGVFVSARDIKPITPGESLGAALDSAAKWPLGLARKKQLPTYRVSGEVAALVGTYEALGLIPLSAKARVLNGQRYLESSEGTYLAESDLVVLKRRHEFPSFVNATLHWLDVDASQGLVVFYEGERAVHVTRTCSVLERPLKPGTAWVESKQITDLGVHAPSKSHELNYDTPWLLELDSGLRIHARVGTSEPNPSAESQAVCLEADDAKKLFEFLEPKLPAGWHAVKAERGQLDRSPVLIR